MMMHKLFEEAGAPVCGSLTLTANMNQSREGQGLEGLRGTASVQRKRTVLSGGMFNHNSRSYSRHS